MKYLKINENKGYFLRQGEGGVSEWFPIDQISKDDLLALLHKAVSEIFEMDDFTEDNLSNKAHFIIYKNLHEKFIGLIANKTRFKDESDGLYKAALEKYGF